MEFRFDCGTGAARLRSRRRVKLNQWNRAVVSRSGADGWLRLNDDDDDGGEEEEEEEEREEEGGGRRSGRRGNVVSGRAKGHFSRITVKGCVTERAVFWLPFGA